MAKGTVKIYGDLVKGCIFFDGSTIEPKFLGTIFAEEKPDEAGRIIIYRTDRQDENGNDRKLFQRKKADKIQNEAGEDLVSALGYTTADVVAYINEQANLTAAVNPVVDTSLNGVDVSFKLDATSTSIILDNGYQYGVNTIKALDTGDGLITIKSIEDARTLFTQLDHTMVDINGTDAVGGLNDVINVLNELFTVGAFESVVISDPYSTMVADVNGIDAGYTLEGADAIDPIGDDIFTYDGTGYANYAGLKSVATIDQAGEYYTFDIRGEGTIGFGLIHTQESFDAGLYSGNVNYANPVNYAAINSAHYGFQFSHWFHPTPNGSWTNYGANTTYSMRAGWSNFNGTDEQSDWLAGNPIKVRCGIDENGYISIETLRGGSTWVVHARSGYPIPQGSSYHLGIKSQSTSARVFSAPKVHLLEPEAPTMHFRYIESPDGVFHYPLFATEEEAKYYHEVIAGVSEGVTHTHNYVDDPTGTTWYMPDNGQMAGVNAPYNMVFSGQTVLFTEITSLSNSDLVPTAFSGYDLTIDELSSVNYQTQPQDTGYTTTINNLPSSLTVNGGGMISGTAPEVTGDNSVNPSDTYAVEVVRTNSYGSSIGNLNIIVTNLTPPSSLPSGFTQIAGSFTDNGDGTYTVDNSSVIRLDLTLAQNKRVVVPTSWVEDNVLPLDHNVAESKAFFGIADANANWSNTPDLHADFDAVVRWEAISSSQHKTSMSVGDLINANHNTVSSASVSYWNYAIEWDGTQLHVLRSATLSDLQTKHRNQVSGLVISDEPTHSPSGALPLVVATRSGGTMTLSTSGLSIIDIPEEPITILTPWTKALDFSGSNEHAKQVGTSSNYMPIACDGITTTVPANTTTGYTSDNLYSRPFATAIVFKIDGHNSNQHIWNQGGGVNDDNIYLRLDASSNLYFGWGRDGSGVNECKIGGLGTNKWYGVYISHNGTRLSASDATAANLAETFEIKLMQSSDSFNATYTHGTETQWTNGSTGERMDRNYGGTFTVGGRGSNRNFHGKVASMVCTTLRNNQPMPTDAEIKLMITDPKKWLSDYKNGNLFRVAYGANEQTFINGATYQSNSVLATQVWLMGDGTNDSYSNMIRNQVMYLDQNYTKMQLNSMVSNDIETVNIAGLT